MQIQRVKLLPFFLALPLILSRLYSVHCKNAKFTCVHRWQDEDNCFLPISPRFILTIPTQFLDLFPRILAWIQAPWLQRTVGQNNQKYTPKYWATHKSVGSFARTAHSFAWSALLASLARSVALTHSLTLLTPELVGHWLIRWLFILCFPLIWPIVQRRIIKTVTNYLS